MKIYTIGFTQKSAPTFFELLTQNGVQRVIDIRLNNTSQLAGFTKKDDFKYFLKELADIEYYHFDFLAPTKEIRDTYNKSKNWDYLEGKNYNDFGTTVIAEDEIDEFILFATLTDDFVLR